jgi:hypothetical protein
LSSLWIILSMRGGGLSAIPAFASNVIKLLSMRPEIGEEITGYFKVFFAKNWLVMSKYVINDKLLL